MSERIFTPPTKFPAKYVDGTGDKIVLLARTNNPHYPLIGYDRFGEAVTFTEEGLDIKNCVGKFDLQDIPKRITTWHNVYPASLAFEFKSREDADENAVVGRLAVYRIERDEDGGNPEIFVEDVR